MSDMEIKEETLPEEVAAEETVTAEEMIPEAEAEDAADAAGKLKGSDKRRLKKAEAELAEANKKLEAMEATLA